MGGSVPNLRAVGDYKLKSFYASRGTRKLYSY